MQKITAFCILFLLQLPILGQVPYIQSFSPRDFKGAAQTWNAAQNNNGIMYFANSDGILIYDGIDWDLVRLSNKALAENVVIDSADGTVYAAGNGNIGYLQKDSHGKFSYISIKNKIEEKYRNFKRVLNLTIYKHGLAFTSNRTLYLYNGESFSCTSLDSRGRFLIIEGELYLSLYNGEAYHVSAHTVQPVAISDILGKDIGTVYSVCRFGTSETTEQKKYLVYSNQGLFVSSKGGSEITPFSIHNFDYQLTDIFEFKSLNTDRLCFEFKNGEILITDLEGNIELHLNESNGLIGRTMNSFQDHSNHLWILTGTGINYVEIGSPFSIFDSRQGLSESILSLYHHPENSINYIGTERGVFYINSKKKVVPIDGLQIKNQIWNFKEIHGRHLIATGYGVYELKDNKVKQLIRQRWVHSLGKLQNRKDAFLFGTYADGLFVAKFRNGQWTKQAVKGFTEETRYIEEDLQGQIWISHYNKGLYKLELSDELDRVTKKEFYDDTKGLPSKENNRVFKLKNGEIVVTTRNGFYHYNPASNRFQAHEKLNKNLPNNFCIYNIAETPTGDIWLWAAELEPAKAEVAALLKKQASGEYTLEKETFSKIKKEIRDFSVDIDAPLIAVNTDEAFFGQAKNLINYQAKQEKKEMKLQVLFKEVNLGDSSYYYGTNYNTELSYNQNDIRIAVALPSFESVQNNKYRFKLNGYKDHWTAWNQSNFIQFTNLPEGDYVLEAQAQNAYGQFAESAILTFTIQPPFYRSVLAYIAYVLFSILAIYGIVHWNTHRLKAQKAKLEQEVDERTRELKLQTEELFQMNEEIQAQRTYLEETNNKLSEYNTQIRDSISAGKIIQDALLPFTNRIDECFKNYFILYQPKDIVSGDFYWLTQTKEAAIIAIIDCTGHGVPGAFMSLLAYSLLNEIVEVGKVEEPSAILNKLNTRVNYALGNTKRRSKGGMDMSVCKVFLDNDENIKLSYSGAKRPLYYIVDNELKKLSANNYSIGIVHREPKSYSSTELELPKGSMLYLTTDGLVDEPNEKRKKFGTPKFEELLQSIHQLPPPEQKAKLEHSLQLHRGKTKQRDDITVVGIRL